MKKIFIALIVISFTMCKPVNLISVYNNQLIDTAYIKIDKKIDLFENIAANSLAKKLGSEKIIFKYEIKAKHYTGEKLTKTTYNQKSYIPVKFSDVNKTNDRGKIILKNKYRNNIIYDLQ